MQIFADVTGREFAVAASGQAPALGSAMFGAVAAGAAAGGYDSIVEASRHMAHLGEDRYRPDRRPPRGLRRAVRRVRPPPRPVRARRRRRDEDPEGDPAAGGRWRSSRRRSPVRDRAVEREPFGTAPDGTAVERYRCPAQHGIAVSVITYGAAVQQLWAPGPRRRGGRTSSSGSPTLDGYAGAPRPLLRRDRRPVREPDRPRARSALDGVTYRLPANDGRQLAARRARRDSTGGLGGAGVPPATRPTLALRYGRARPARWATPARSRSR